jgi:hypothetical protein
LVGVVACLVVGTVGNATAASRGRAGTLDPSFGHGGKVIARAPKAVANSAFGAAALASDGDLVVELKREGPGRREIERRLPDGSLDPSFGKRGKVTVGSGKGLAPRPDGSILVATNSCGPKHGSVVLLGASGDRVTSFGEGGCGPAVGFAADYIVPGPGGTTYLAGSAALCPCGKGGVLHREPAVARLGPDGNLDPGFGKGGVVHLHADLNVQLEPQSLETREADGIVPTATGGVVVAAGNLLVGEQMRRGESDPAASAGDDRDLPIKLSHVLARPRTLMRG